MYIFIFVRATFLKVNFPCFTSISVKRENNTLLLNNNDYNQIPIRTGILQSPSPICLHSIH